jgi:ribosomal protein L44E
MVEPRLPSVQEVASAVLKCRNDCEQYANEAIASGRKKEARSLAANLRRFEKLISDYGLRDYA